MVQLQLLRLSLLYSTTTKTTIEIELKNEKDKSVYSIGSTTVWASLGVFSTNEITDEIKNKPKIKLNNVINISR